MILYIEEDIHIHEEESSEVQDYLNKFAIRNKYIGGGSILIEAQKITLDEVNMNDLFSNLLMDFEISYGFAGGKGCDFAITLGKRIKKTVDLTWHVVDEFCACLVFKYGDPLNINDRAAFIEKTPRVLIEGKWVQGPKGSGGDFETEGETIYGFYQPSREWCEEKVKEIYNTYVPEIKNLKTKKTKKAKK